MLDSRRTRRRLNHGELQAEATPLEDQELGEMDGVARAVTCADRNDDGDDDQDISQLGVSQRGPESQIIEQVRVGQLVQ